MSIAIVNDTQHHNCCIGSILEIFKNTDIQIDLYLLSDIYNYMIYYKKIFNMSKINIYIFSNLDLSKYNLIIKITSHTPHDNYLSIAHIKQHTDTNNNFLTFYPPLIDKNIKYIFPFYNGLINTKIKQNIITYIGYSKPNYIDDDLIEFINNSGYIFNFIINDIESAYILNNYKNVNIYIDTDTSQMINYINQSKFILCRKIPYQLTDRYSGSYGIAISHNIPLIIQTYFANIYFIPGIKYDTNYMEILNQIKNITDDDYKKLVKDLVKFKIDMSIHNKNVLDTYIMPLIIHP